MPSEAKKYWLYSRACAVQAERSKTEGRRSRLLELSRTWSDAAMREEVGAERVQSIAARKTG